MYQPAVMRVLQNTASSNIITLSRIRTQRRAVNTSKAGCVADDGLIIMLEKFQYILVFLILVNPCFRALSTSIPTTDPYTPPQPSLSFAQNSSETPAPDHPNAVASSKRYHHGPAQPEDSNRHPTPPASG